MNFADVVRAAQGASVIAHAANPPGYRRWDESMLPMLGNTIAAPKAEYSIAQKPAALLVAFPRKGEPRLSARYLGTF